MKTDDRINIYHHDKNTITTYTLKETDELVIYSEPPFKRKYNDEYKNIDIDKNVNSFYNPPKNGDKND